MSAALRGAGKHLIRLCCQSAIGNWHNPICVVPMVQDLSVPAGGF